MKKALRFIFSPYGRINGSTFNKAWFVYLILAFSFRYLIALKLIVALSWLMLCIKRFRDTGHSLNNLFLIISIGLLFEALGYKYTIIPLCIVGLLIYLALFIYLCIASSYDGQHPAQAQKVISISISHISPRRCLIPGAIIALLISNIVLGVIVYQQQCFIQSINARVDSIEAPVVQKKKTITRTKSIPQLESTIRDLKLKVDFLESDIDNLNNQVHYGY